MKPSRIKSLYKKPKTKQKTKTKMKAKQKQIKNKIKNTPPKKKNKKKLVDLWVHWVPVVTVVYNDWDASI